MKEHLLALKTVNKFYAAAWGIILLTADAQATSLANKQWTEDVKGALETLKKVKNSLLNYQEISVKHRLYAHLFASPENNLFRGSGKTEEKEITSSFGLKENLDDPTRNKQSITTLIEKFCDPQNVESIQVNGRNNYLITLDNPKPGQYFGTGYTFDFYKKQWYQGPYNQVQVKLQENGYHSFYPILDEKQLRETTNPQKTTRSVPKEAKTEYQRQYKNPFDDLQKLSKNRRFKEKIKEPKEAESESSSEHEEKPLLEVKISEENASSNSSSSQALIEEIAQTSPGNLTQQYCCQKLKEWKEKAINCLKEQTEKVKNYFSRNSDASKKES
ncbi:MAG: hypothetical protein BGO07_04215 [Alphaproteobacteria bacterium 40-19]|nr:MAG: hypothetical protein BGO07_04215 [Alphaproteobacteria bacterium 40-19]